MHRRQFKKIPIIFFLSILQNIKTFSSLGIFRNYCKAMPNTLNLINYCLSLPQTQSIDLRIISSFQNFINFILDKFLLNLKCFFFVFLYFKNFFQYFLNFNITAFSTVDMFTDCASLSIPICYQIGASPSGQRNHLVPQ